MIKAIQFPTIDKTVEWIECNWLRCMHRRLDENCAEKPGGQLGDGKFVFLSFLFWFEGKCICKFGKFFVSQGNHDQHRVASRLGKDRIDSINMILLTLPGISVNYNVMSVSKSFFGFLTIIRYHFYSIFVYREKKSEWLINGNIVFIRNLI